jgi:hypothetical protein
LCVARSASLRCVAAIGFPIPELVLEWKQAKFLKYLKRWEIPKSLQRKAKKQWRLRQKGQANKNKNKKSKVSGLESLDRVVENLVGVH